MLGQGSCSHFQHHGGKLPRGMVVLLHTVHNPLTRSEVHHPATCNRVGNGSSLSGMFTFAFDGKGGATEHV